MSKVAGSRPPPPPDTRPPPPPLGPEGAQGGRPSWRGWVVLALLLFTVAIWQHFAANDEGRPAISYTSFYKAVEEKKIDSVTLRGQVVTGHFKPPATIEGRTLEVFRTLVPAQEDRDLLPLLREKGVIVSVRTSAAADWCSRTGNTAPLPLA